MLINDTSLYLRPEEFEQGYGSAFEFRNRYLLNFIRRHVQAAKLESVDYLAIAVQGTRDTKDKVWVENKVLVSCVVFHQQEYDELFTRGHELHEYYIELFMRGIDAAARVFHVPVAEIESAVRAFREGGYVNSWVHARKRIRPGLYASLICSMDSEAFRLRLRVEHRDRVVYDNVVLTELPDEICFKHMFKTVGLVGDQIVVSDKYGATVFALPLETLSLSP